MDESSKLNDTSNSEISMSLHNNNNNLQQSPTKSIAAIKDDDWKSLVNSITYLFHKKKLQKLELDVLNSRVRNVRDSQMGSRILDYYKDSILKKGMIVLRENIKEKKGAELLDRLSDVWSQFYTSILPTLLAIFYPVQERGVYIRSVTLVGFRDIVLLKTKINDALIPGEKVSSEIKQMLLVLASIHDTDPPCENYMKLEKLVGRVVSPYLGFDGLYTKARSPLIKRISLPENKLQNVSVNSKDRKMSRSQIIKEEVSRKLRRNSGTAVMQNAEVCFSDIKKTKEGSFRARFRLGVSSSNSNKTTNTEIVDLMNSPTLDDDMISYMNEREDKWKQRQEFLTSESLL